MGFCTRVSKNEFETTVVNEPSVFEPLKHTEGLLYHEVVNYHFVIKPVSLHIQAKLRLSSKRAAAHAFSKLSAYTDWLK